MHRSHHAVALAALVAMPGIAGEPVRTEVGPLEEVLTMRVEGRLVVGPDGKVQQHEIKTDLDPTFRKLVDDAVNGWLFLPPMKDGKAIAVRSDMRITLKGTQIEEGYKVAIDNIVFPLPVDDKAKTAATPVDDVHLRVETMRPMPQYPGYHVNGLVMLVLRIHPDGSVAEIAPTQCSLYFAKGPSATLRRACKAMQDGAVSAIKRWKFAYDANGKTPTPEQLTGHLPVFYRMPGDNIASEATPGKWRLETRSEYRTPAWHESRKQRVGTADVVANEMLPTNPLLQFREGAPGA